jgi:hypothetical protein
MGRMNDEWWSCGNHLVVHRGEEAAQCFITMLYIIQGFPPPLPFQNSPSEVLDLKQTSSSMAVGKKTISNIGTLLVTNGCCSLNHVHFKTDEAFAERHELLTS